jgi:hypothetical protein
MLIPPPDLSPSRHRTVAAPVLSLISATYDTGSSVTLKFNQPINTSALNGPAISVNDYINGTVFIGTEATPVRIDPFTVQIDLEENGPYAGQTTTLNATNDTRIRTIPGAKSWAGVTDLPLPFRS